MMPYYAVVATPPPPQPSMPPPPSDGGSSDTFVSTPASTEGSINTEWTITAERGSPESLINEEKEETDPTDPPSLVRESSVPPAGLLHVPVAKLPPSQVHRSRKLTKNDFTLTLVRPATMCGKTRGTAVILYRTYRSLDPKKSNYGICMKREEEDDGATFRMKLVVLFHESNGGYSASDVYEWREGDVDEPFERVTDSFRMFHVSAHLMDRRLTALLSGGPNTIIPVSLLNQCHPLLYRDGHNATCSKRHTGVSSKIKKTGKLEWRPKDETSNGKAVQYGNEHFLECVHFDYGNPAGLTKCDKDVDCAKRLDPLHNLVFYHGVYNVRNKAYM